MTSEDKARELVEKFNIISCPTNGWYSMSNYQSIQCAIIAVDEVIYNILNFDPSIDYWKSVKQHLEKML